MIDQITDFVKTNAVAIAIGVVAVIALVVIFVFKRGGSSESMQNIPTMPPHDMDGMESMNTVCDLATGVCHPQDHMQVAPEQHHDEQMQQQMQQQMMEEQMQHEQQTSM